MNIVTLNAINNSATWVETLEAGSTRLIQGVTCVITDEAPEVGAIFDTERNTFAPVPRKRWITKLAFDSRFSLTEAVALKAMQAMPARAAEETDAEYIQRTQVPAQLQVLQSRLNMASYIDLDREDTRGAVLSLEVLGLLGQGRAIEILDGPISEHEFYKEA